MLATAAAVAVAGGCVAWVLGGCGCVGFAVGVVAGAVCTGAVRGRGVRGYPGGYEELDAVLLNLRSDTAWMNLGYWAEGVVEYADACERLACELGNWAELCGGDRVLDVGFGKGEQCAVWWERYGVRSLVGVNISAAEVAAAQARMERATRGGRGDVELLVGSGTDLKRVMEGGREPFTCVVSLDSAYHYHPSRQAFMWEAHRVLGRGGRLAVADIVTKRPLMAYPVWVRAVLWMTGIPACNCVPPETYVRQLEDAGYQGVRVRSIGGDVFRGFAAYVERHETRFGGVVPPWQWMKLRGAAAAARLAHAHDVLDFVLVSAEKP